jgi:hypothetical protein
MLMSDGIQIPRRQQAQCVFLSVEAFCIVAVSEVVY